MHDTNIPPTGALIKYVVWWLLRVYILCLMCSIKLVSYIWVSRKRLKLHKKFDALIFHNSSWSIWYIVYLWQQSNISKRLKHLCTQIISNQWIKHWYFFQSLNLFALYRHSHQMLHCWYLLSYLSYYIFTLINDLFVLILLDLVISTKIMK